MTKTRVAVVGLGRMGRRHLDLLRAMHDVELTGVLDHHACPPERNYADMSDLLADRPDAVVVATPPVSHHALAASLLEAGVHVLVEKPLTTRPDTSQALVSLAAQVSRCLAVGFVERFNDAVVDLHLPTCTTIETRRCVASTPALDVEVDVLLDLAVHDVDLVRFLTGAEYEDVDVLVGPLDGDGRATAALISAQLSDGCSVVHHVAWGAARKRDLSWLRDGEQHHRDLSRPGSALQRQAEAFLAACRGGDPGRLALGSDGLRAVTIACHATSSAHPAPGRQHGPPNRVDTSTDRVLAPFG